MPSPDEATIKLPCEIDGCRAMTTFTYFKADSEHKATIVKNCKLQVKKSHQEGYHEPK